MIEKTYNIFHSSKWGVNLVTSDHLEKLSLGEEAYEKPAQSGIQRETYEHLERSYDGTEHTTYTKRRWFIT